MIGPLPFAARPPGWRGRLNAYLAEVGGTPFGYGSLDCALFAAGCVGAMTGIDPAAAWRGRYTTLEQGVRALRRAGHADPEALATALYAEVPVAEAQVGDLAVLAEEADGLPIMGIVVGARIAVLRPEGLATIPLVDEARARPRPAARRMFRP